MIVKEPGFKKVSAPLKSPMQRLIEMSGKKEKIPPVEIKNLNRKISIPKLKEKKLKAFNVPRVGKQDKDFPIEILKAWVDYKIFSDSVTWHGFSSSHKVSKLAPDFSKENVLILVSLSRIPSGVFSIVSVGKTEKAFVVKYKVNHLVMSEGYEGDSDFYSAALIEKSNLPIKLVQQP